MLSSAGSLLVTRSALCQPVPTFVTWLSRTPPCTLVLPRHTTARHHAKQPCNKMSASVFFIFFTCNSFSWVSMHSRFCFICWQRSRFHHTLHVCRVWELLFFVFLSSVCANILRSSGPTRRKVVKVKPGDEQLNTPSRFKSDFTLNKLRGQLLINRYTLTSWIDPKREVQRCRSLTAGHFICGSDLKRSPAAGNVRRTVHWISCRQAGLCAVRTD